MSLEAVGETVGRVDQDRPTRDELFHVLRNRRRRFAIHHLKQAPEPVDVGDLATQVAAWENGVSTREVTSRQRRRVYNALQQTHLSELSRMGLVEVERREVTLTDRAEDLDIYLEIVPRQDIPWSEYYLALGSIGLAMTVVTWLNVGPFALLSDIAAGVFLSVTLFVSAVANYYTQYESRLGDAEKPPELRGE
jgi:DNA-binding transcriptional ArsR family regulator